MGQPAHGEAEEQVQEKLDGVEDQNRAADQPDQKDKAEIVAIGGVVLSDPDNPDAGGGKEIQKQPEGAQRGAYPDDAARRL